MPLLEAKLLTWDLTTNSAVAQGFAAGAPAQFVQIVAFTAVADPGNSAKILFGGAGTPTIPLQPGISCGFGLPPGYFINSSEMSVSGAGTSGLILHIAAFIVPG